MTWYLESSRTFQIVHPTRRATKCQHATPQSNHSIRVGPNMEISDFWIINELQPIVLHKKKQCHRHFPQIFLLWKHCCVFVDLPTTPPAFGVARWSTTFALWWLMAWPSVWCSCVSWMNGWTYIAHVRPTQQGHKATRCDSFQRNDNWLNTRFNTILIWILYIFHILILKVTRFYRKYIIPNISELIHVLVPMRYYRKYVSINLSLWPLRVSKCRFGSKIRTFPVNLS